MGNSLLPDFSDLLQQPDFGGFLKVWQSARQGAELPRRQELSLRDMAPYLERMLVYEWDEDARLSSRIMGSDVQERVKLSAQSLNWMDHIAADLVDISKQWWNGLYAQPCAGAMEYSIGYLDGKCKLGQCLLLPVRPVSGQLQVFALNYVDDIYRIDPDPDSLTIGADRLKTCYYDIGFDLPDDAEDIVVHKMN